MQFSQIEVTASGANHVYQPYDRGAAGAFVWRQQGMQVHAPRLLVTSKTDDSTNDKLTVQNNIPRVCPSDNNCETDALKGTDLVKSELRFLATTSTADRQKAIDLHIALLQELRNVIENRETIYA